MVKQIKKLASNVLGAANYDFCPSANHYVHWIKQPIGWVIGAIGFSILVGLFVGPQGYILAAAFGSLLILGLVWPWLSMKGLRCTLIVPDHRLWENKQFDITFKVQNYWPIPVFGLMVKGDFLQELGIDEEPIVFSFRRIPAWADTEFRIPVTARRRGVLPDGIIEVSNGFPFGLTEISREVSVPQTTTVWPACETLDGQPESMNGIQNVLGTLCDRSGNDGDTIGVRTWQMGDRLKNIHWAQSARSQRLMVRERQTLAATTTLIIVDLSPQNHAGEGVQSSYEWAIRLAASVCWQLHRNGNDIQIVFTGLDSPDNKRLDNRTGVERLMNSLASLPSLQELNTTEDQNWRGQIPVHPSGSVFLIGTNRTEHCGGVNLKRILIDLKGFEPDDDQPDTARQSDRKSSEASVLVTAPGLAADELKSDWSRSFSNATV